MKFILCSDLHLRPDRPLCRVDKDWAGTQEKQLSFIVDVANEYKVPVAIAGDIFHRSTVPYWLINSTLDIFSKSKFGVYILPGQHDLPGHNFNNVSSSSYGVLLKVASLADSYVFDVSELGAVKIFGENEVYDILPSDILFTHELIMEKESQLFPGSDAITAEQALRKYRSFKWIFSGDNHHGYHYGRNGRHVIMSGCMNRQTSDMIDYTPVVWLIDTEDELVDQIEIPDDVNMVTDNHIIKRDEKNGRIASFAEKVKVKANYGFDFIDNVKKSLKESELSKEVSGVVYELIEEGIDE